MEPSVITVLDFMGYCIEEYTLHEYMKLSCHSFTIRQGFTAIAALCSGLASE